MSDVEPGEDAGTWWKSSGAQALAEAEAAVAAAYDEWERVREMAEKQTVQEWQLYPNSPMFHPYHEVIMMLAEETGNLPKVKAAWERFVEAVQLQQRALQDWMEEICIQEERDTMLRRE